jgi:cbb3-type cytochrome oxidase subunit 3
MMVLMILTFAICFILLAGSVWVLVTGKEEARARERRRARDLDLKKDRSE